MKRIFKMTRNVSGLPEETCSTVQRLRVSGFEIHVACHQSTNFVHAEKASIDTGVILFFREAILPKAGESSAPRLRALGKDFHPLCFKCQVGGSV